jgi:tetratricopeptide (TPR) repeat protein
LIASSLKSPALEPPTSSLSELSSSGREFLNVAAVLGDDFELDVLASICSLDQFDLLNSLDEARRAGILEPHADHGGRYRFRETLVRQFIYRHLSSHRRVELHGQAADALETIDGKAAGIAAEIVEHLQRARDGSHNNSDVPNGFDSDAEGARTDSRLNYLIRLGLSQARAGHFKASLKTLLQAGAMAQRAGNAYLLARAVVAAPVQLLPLPGSHNPAVALLARSALSMDQNLKPDLQARLLARIAGELSSIPAAFKRAEMLIAEALEIVAGCCSEVQLQVLIYRDLLLRNPLSVDQRIANSYLIDELAAAVGDPVAVHFGSFSRAAAYLERGEISLAESAWREGTAAAELANRPDLVLSTSLVRASSAFGQGRLEDARAILLELTETSGGDAEFDIAEAMLALVCREQGAFFEANSAALKAFERRPSCAAYGALLALINVDLGNQQNGRFYFERLSADCYRDLANDAFLLASGALLADSCIKLGDFRRAETLYSLLLPYGSHIIVMGHSMSLGPVSFYLGVLALFLERFEAAREHLEEALVICRSNGLRLWAVHTTYHLAWCTSTGTSGTYDTGRNERLLQETIAEAEALGMIHLLGQGTSELEKLRQKRVDLTAETKASIDQKSLVEVKNMTTASNGARVETIQLYEEDETFVLRLSGRQVRLKRSRGLELMLMLIREPGREFHVTDLGQASGPDTRRGEAQQSTDGGPMLDAPAKQSYRTRLKDLREEREEAQKYNDFERVSRIEEEINFLARELARAVGLKGSDRKAFSDAERARVRVTQAIRTTIRKIRRHDMALGWYLGKAIRTGSFCSYTPAPHAIDLFGNHVSRNGSSDANAN